MENIILDKDRDSFSKDFEGDRMEDIELFNTIGGIEKTEFPLYDFTENNFSENQTAHLFYSDTDVNELKKNIPSGNIFSYSVLFLRILLKYVCNVITFK